MNRAGLVLVVLSVGCDVTLAPIRPGNSDSGSAADSLLVNDAAASSSPCRQASDCPSGLVCSIDPASGGCVEPRCGLPAASDGPKGLGFACNRHDASCAAGLLCVPTLWVVSRTEGVLVPSNGVCLRQCDPCLSNCPGAASCIQLSDEGGFCHTGPLASGTENCGVYAICASGLDCRGCASGSCGTCQRPCRPDSGLLDFGADTSKDCAADEICAGAASNRDGQRFHCEPGRLAPTGTECSFGGGTSPPYCDPSRDVCRPICRDTEDILCTRGVCSPIAGCPPCPEGSECVDLGLERDVCIADGALPFNAACALDRHCRPGLSCLEDATAGKVCRFPE